MILPGATLGVLGGGQLGQMFALAARRLGFHVWVLDPDPCCPAGGVAHRHLCAPLDDRWALEELCRSTAAITVEMEHIPPETLEFCDRHGTLRPGLRALRIAQDRRLEKGFFHGLGLPTAPFAVIGEGPETEDAQKAVPFPAILKTAREGYDGRGQAHVENPAQLEAARAALGTVPAVLEGRVSLALEISVILARGEDGMAVFFPVAENHHHRGILDLCIVPARCDGALQTRARQMALQIAEALAYVGVLAVEFFVTEDGQLLVNEMAPRPHNSGHYTLDACVQSQFDQQVRTLCGWPLADTRLLSPAVMMNLLGDLWLDHGDPGWFPATAHPQVKPYLYGKSGARRGRKMGHATILAPSLEGALAIAGDLRRTWNWPR